jgi:hypothetical protein
MFWRVIGAGGIRLAIVWIFLVIVVGGLLGMAWQAVAGLF